MRRSSSPKNGGRLIGQVLVKGRNDKTDGGNSVARDSNGSENGLFEMLDQLLECFVIQIVAKHDELGVA